MPIPEFYKVDFSPWRKDLVEAALKRLLSQHYDKCVLRQFTAAIMAEVQTLFDALLDLQERRTLYQAEGATLDAIGRIVGEPRKPYSYDEQRWMFADRQDQSPDSTYDWCLGAPFAAFLPVGDEQYRMNILARIVKNHTLTASVPEMERLTRLLIGSQVSYEKTGPMQVGIIVPSTLSQTGYAILTQASSDRRADNAYMLPYPATLNLSGLSVYVPNTFFCADRDERQRGDCAPCAVSLPLTNPGE